MCTVKNKYGNSSLCEEIYTCCDCGGNYCGCPYCWSCNACEECLEEVK